jgi:hypothetical protein
VRLIASRTAAPLATNGARARASVATLRAQQARERATQARSVLKWQDQRAARQRWR